MPRMESSSKDRNENEPSLHSSSSSTSSKEHDCTNCTSATTLSNTNTGNESKDDSSSTSKALRRSFENLQLDISPPSSLSSSSVAASNQDEEEQSSQSNANANAPRPIYLPSRNSESDETSASASSLSISTSWELTWPIWHMLPRSERKEIARQNGCRTIGEFEEYVTLSRAVTNTTSALSVNTGRGGNGRRDGSYGGGGMYDNERLYEEEQRPEGYGLPVLAERSDSYPNRSDNEGDSDNDTTNLDSDIDEEDYNENKTENDDENVKQENDTTKLQHEEALRNGGLILLIPDEIISQHILPFLDVDYYAVCAKVSPHWKSFARGEPAFKDICQRSYLIQSKNRMLRVQRFQNSYRIMLEKRPRVKTGGGLYVMKYSQIKPIQRDMWTEVPVGAILEITYYRYMRFHENGRVMYALSNLPPHEMIPKFVLHLQRSGANDIERVNDNVNHNNGGVVWGTYEVERCTVTVQARHPWHHVQFQLGLLREGAEGARGTFWAMSFDKHLSSPSGNFDEYQSRDLVKYKVPSQPFRFLRDWRL